VPLLWSKVTSNCISIVSCLWVNLPNLTPTTVGKYSWPLFSVIDTQTRLVGKPLSEAMELMISVTQKSLIGVYGGHVKQNPPLLMSAN